MEVCVSCSFLGASVAVVKFIRFISSSHFMDELNYCIFYFLQISERGSPFPCCIQMSPGFVNSVDPDQLAS